MTLLRRRTLPYRNQSTDSSPKTLSMFLSSEFGKEKIGLYRDDDLSCFQNMTSPQAERVKKKICETFQSCGLKITIETNLKITDFLDVTLNLKNEKYYPFRKPNNINAPSNHPKSIIKEIPNMIGKCISCDEHEFKKAKWVITKL